MAASTASISFALPSWHVNVPIIETLLIVVLLCDRGRSSVGSGSHQPVDLVPTSVPRAAVPTSTRARRFFRAPQDLTIDLPERQVVPCGTGCRDRRAPTGF